MTAGASRAAIDAGMPLVYAGSSAALLAAALLGRKRQMRRS